MMSMNSPQFDLHTRVVLLTGSTGYLGQAMALGLADAGATVLLNSRLPQKVADQVAALSARGRIVEAVPFDVTDGEERRLALAGIARRHGRLDGIVNSAYAAPTGEGPEAFLEAYNVAVASAWALVTDALELLGLAAMQHPGGASVVNIASMYGIVSPDLRIYSDTTPPNPPFYGPAKAALLQLTRYLACELGPRKIRVNAVSPGPFPSPAVGREDPEFVKRLGSRVALGRIGQPLELTGPLIFLLSDASSFVTGANLVVDGGWTSW
jgi:NAD(P)-dependent dehydrogenase (short-subunit alcohol dehydrogenase family)